MFFISEEGQRGSVSVRKVARGNGWTVYVAVHTGLRWALLTNQCMKKYGVVRKEFSNIVDAENRIKEVTEIVAKNWANTGHPVIEDWWWHGQQYAVIRL